MTPTYFLSVLRVTLTQNIKTNILPSKLIINCLLFINRASFFNFFTSLLLPHYPFSLKNSHSTLLSLSLVLPPTYQWADLAPLSLPCCCRRHHYCHRTVYGLRQFTSGFFLAALVVVITIIIYSVIRKCMYRRSSTPPPPLPPSPEPELVPSPPPSPPKWSSFAPTAPPLDQMPQW